jgi:deoxyribose-phosphate aldolase
MKNLGDAPIDAVATAERIMAFQGRSIKKESKVEALCLAISMTDLTTLEGADTAGKVEALCRKGIAPVPQILIPEIKIPSVAAICVYPEQVPTAVKTLAGSGVQVASVATSFPAGQVPLDLKLADVKRAILFGADEIDMVIDRGAFFQGDLQKVAAEIAAVKALCVEGRSRAGGGSGSRSETEKAVHLKVILETGELGTLDNVRKASWLAMEAGADFIKTSTGKIPQAANLSVTYVMLQAIYEYYLQTGIKIGMKPAGGIRTAKEAISYLVMVKEVLGNDWLTPDLFRFGASTLLTDLLRQLFKEVKGDYFYCDFLAID